MSRKGILVIVNLDTRGPEFVLVKETIENRGLNAIVMDFSMEMEPPYPGDITCEEVAEAGGLSIEEVRYLYNKSDRIKATDNQIAGGIKIAKRLLEEGKIHGAIGIGGGTSSLVATSIMKQLPFGMPKLMASPMAAHPRYISKYVGTKDMTMHHTVLDIVGLNPLLKIQLMNAIGAICGMVELSEGWEIKSDKPLIAVSAFGQAERAVEHAIHYLKDLGYEPIVTHAQGVGDRAMDEMIAEGLFQGVIDFVTGGITDELFGGNCAGGPNRILAACKAKIPQIVAPAGLEKISYGGRSDLYERFAGRKMKITDSSRVQVRVTAEELKQVARVVAERLNEAIAPTKMLYPQKGWSAMSEEGMHIHDPEADAAFLEELKKHLKKEVEIVELPLALNTEEFAKKAVELFDEMYKTWINKN
ncbi:Tm-1-like ATP-binding domain-containing protein [Desulfallas sp. Bu1-1]|uniref:Tm-1-like ATP-binding domain-containing protein n=1 Tax=Desulfallas sp. Bu1-1 TaxID=2787620 RepID=UPI001A9B4552|nr:Tm-1-like ATP-binding domain-containing protein [Desulfallas sp. Bu1-1]